MSDFPPNRSNIIEIEPIHLRIRHNDPDLILLRLYTDLSSRASSSGSGGGARHRLKRNKDVGGRCYCSNSNRHGGSNTWKELGREIGKNTQLKKIGFCGLRTNVTTREMEHLEAFCKGLNVNRSIEELSFFACLFVAQGAMLQVLKPFFENNKQLSSLGIRRCDLGPEGICALSSSLIRSHSIKKIDFSNNRIDGESVEELVKALYLNHELEELSLAGNDVGRYGCMALAALLQNPQSMLKKLNLRCNNINDEGAITLAESLMGNNKLTHLGLGGNESIHDPGWDAFSRVICDATSISTTYYSNHTLAVLTSSSHHSPASYLELNRCHNKHHVARQKIFGKHFDHPNFVTVPFVEMESSLLIHVLKFIDQFRGDGMENRNVRHTILFQLLKNIPQIFGVSGNKTHYKAK